MRNLEIINRFGNPMTLSGNINREKEVMINIDNEALTWINIDEAKQIIEHLKLLFNL